MTWPGVERLQGHEEFGVEEAGRVGAVVGPPMLRDDGFDFRVLLDDGPHLVDIGVAGFERDGLRHLRSDPEVAFLQVRHEFQAEAARGNHGDHQEHGHAAQSDDAVIEREPERGFIDFPGPEHQEGFSLFDISRQDHRAEGDGDGEGGQEAAGDGVGIGLGHWAEDVAFDARQGEERQEARDDNGGGEENRLADFARSFADSRQLVEQQPIAPAHRLVPASSMGQVSEDVLHHDHGGVDHQSEIDRAHGEQIGGFSSYGHD